MFFVLQLFFLKKNDKNRTLEKILKKVVATTLKSVVTYLRKIVKELCRDIMSYVAT